MKVNALLFTLVSDGDQWTSVSLDDQSLDLSFDEKVTGTWLLVMANHHLESIRGNSDLVVDLGRKHPSKGLRATIARVRPPRIPLLEGNYKAVKQVARSLRDLLHGFNGGLEHSPTCIIGVSESIFEQLASRLGEKTAQPRPQKPARRGPATVSYETSNDHSRQVIQAFELRGDTGPLRKKYIGEAPSVELVRQLIVRVADGDYPVLILGDTGTGKDVVARQIHEMGSRRAHPFIPVNCGGIASSLFESEVFGHIRGSFTGAQSDKPGLWQAAGEGTLFLDEIGDLPLEHQVKVLRALEAKRGRPVGQTKEVQLKARVVAATNGDLASLVRQGRFREDLYYRLRVVVIHAPALREHLEDLPLLAAHLWPRVCGKDQVLAPDVVRELGNYSWPGNVRQLKMVLTRLYAYRCDQPITAAHVRAVFKMEGYETDPTPARAANKAELDLAHGLRLRHLRRVEEAVRSTQNILLPIMEETSRARIKADAQLLLVLRLRLEELDALCAPHKLLGAKTFSAIQRLRASLLYLRGLLEEGDSQSQTFWQEEVETEFNRLLSLIEQETGKMERQSLTAKNACSN